ncbi:MAG: threonine synthase [Ruminococcaceae bacterium]|nr:threonine synthase [Oscillospiraceae bacterium]
MHYLSTRGSANHVSASNAIKSGIAPDGGLFVSSDIVRFSPDEISAMSQLSYIELATKILSELLTDYTKEELSCCTAKAYSKEKFDDDSIAPLYKLNDSVHILELWHGPTCAFKDMALQILPHLLTTAVAKTGEDKKIAILVATSGDTGKAALEGFKNVPGTCIQVFYPQTGVSEIQKLQMVTQDGDNVDVVAVKGNFDNAQTSVKKIFTDKPFNEELNKNGVVLSSANSINWGRLAPQIVYYFSAYCSLIRRGEISVGDKINICVPTGNFGNILAAYYAKCMGLPVNKLICASNENNILTDFINTGVYDKNRDFKTTISPSMDILVSSNLERFLYHATDGDSSVVCKYMNQLSKDGRYEVDDKLKNIISDTFYGGCCDDTTTVRTIKNIFDEFGYVPDTHTAVALNVYKQYVNDTGDSTKTVIASTASPFKFNRSVLSAICDKTEISTDNEFELIKILAQKSNLKIPKSLSGLKNKNIKFNFSSEPDELKNQTKRFLNI